MIGLIWKKLWARHTFLLSKLWETRSGIFKNCVSYTWNAIWWFLNHYYNRKVSENHIFQYNLTIMRKWRISKSKTSNHGLNNNKFIWGTSGATLLDHHFSDVSLQLSYSKQTTVDHSVSNYANISEKLTFFVPWYAHVFLYQGARNVSLSENFAHVNMVSAPTHCKRET